MMRACVLLLAFAVGPALADERGEYLVDMCAACHGPGGASSGSIPALDDLEPAEVVARLIAFRSGALRGTVMNRIARGLSDEDIEAIRRRQSGVK